ncbi:hypothetical protein ACQ4PT_008397 [Festuca glaucescens]
MHATPSLSQWPDLPPDVLREISGRLHDAGDFVRFHSVCKPWRDTAGTRMPNQSFLPWLLAPDKMFSIFLKLRCVFSRTSYRALPPFFSVSQRKWVASSQGTSIWYFAERPSPSLCDPLTGAVTLLLPPFPEDNGRCRWEKPPSGVVYGDGTFFLHSIFDQDDTTKFRVVLLRPGDVAWTVVERTFSSPDLKDFYLSYYHGKIIITVDGPVVTPEDEAGIGDVLAVPRPPTPRELDDYFYEQSYVLESRGELLCVSVYNNLDYPHASGGKASVPGLVQALSVCVHALEEDEAAPGKIHWVRKHGRSLADRVFFLGYPNSFAVEASRLSGDAVSGGCAYFVYDDLDARPNQPCYVFRYNLVDDRAKFMEQLPRGWDGDTFTWLIPQPSIAPIQEIIDRLEGQKWWKKKLPMAPTPRSNIYIEKPQPQCYNPYFRVCVHNLPCDVDRFQLRQFFSKHGKVSNAKVMCKRKSKMFKRIGFITIATVEEQADALASLNGLVFNGCILEVRLVRRWKGRRPSFVPSNQHSRDHLIHMGLSLLSAIGYLIR